MTEASASIEEITPAIAAEMLKASKGNRKLSKRRVNELASMFLRNIHPLLPSGIGFDENGVLVDGHHRLTAVVQSGVSITVVVVRGIKPWNVSYIDTGKARTFVDAAAFSGWPVGSAEAAVAKFAARGADACTPKAMQCHEQTLMDYRFFRAHIDHALEWSGRNVAAPVAGVIARALRKGADADRVRAFCEILRTGIVHDAARDQAAIRLRDELAKIHGGGVRQGKQRYEATQATLDAFLRGKPLRNIRYPVSERF